LGIQDLIDFEFNLTNKQISNLEVDSSQDLIELYDDRLVFGIKNLTANLGMSYMYVSDPPIFADIGDFDLDIENTTMILDMNQFFDSDGLMEIIINSLQLDIAPWRMNFEGISDIS
jgi:hypothetical protein